MGLNKLLGSLTENDLIYVGNAIHKLCTPINGFSASPKYVYGILFSVMKKRSDVGSIKADL